MRVLHIFDFDDTLVNSASSVVINHMDGTQSVLSSDQFATYNEQPGDEMDFSDFDKYPENAELIEDVFEELLAAISRDGPRSVVILTARSNPAPVELFLTNNGVSGIEVHATASSDPRKKAEYVLSRIREDHIDLVKVFEDNARNIRAIRKVVRETGEVGLQTHRIVDGEIANISKMRPTKN
jgi:hypothetical protein